MWLGKRVYSKLDSVNPILNKPMLIISISIHVILIDHLNVKSWKCYLYMILTLNMRAFQFNIFRYDIWLPFSVSIMSNSFPGGHNVFLVNKGSCFSESSIKGYVTVTLSTVLSKKHIRVTVLFRFCPLYNHKDDTERKK